MYLVKMTKNDEVRQDDQQNGRFGQEKVISNTSNRLLCII